jgi:hypothetical protein
VGLGIGGFLSRIKFEGRKEGREEGRKGLGKFLLVVSRG